MTKGVMSFANTKVPCRNTILLSSSLTLAAKAQRLDNHLYQRDPLEESRGGDINIDHHLAYHQSYAKKSKSTISKP